MFASRTIVLCKFVAKSERPGVSAPGLSSPAALGATGHHPQAHQPARLILGDVGAFYHEPKTAPRRLVADAGRITRGCWHKEPAARLPSRSLRTGPLRAWRFRSPTQKDRASPDPEASSGALLEICGRWPARFALTGLSALAFSERCPWGRSPGGGATLAGALRTRRCAPWNTHKGVCEL